MKYVPGVHVDTVPVITRELGVIAGGQRQRDLVGLRPAPVSPRQPPCVGAHWVLGHRHVGGQPGEPVVGDPPELVLGLPAQPPS